MARSFIPLVVVIAIQALAGCNMPKGGVVGSGDNLHASKAERAARDAKLRKQVETGSFGLAQLFPGGMNVDAQHLAPLRPTHATAPVRSLGVAAPRPSEAEMPTQAMQPMMQFASAVTAEKTNACVFKAVMSDADIDACR
jgi:hypothetical protein